MKPKDVLNINIGLLGHVDSGKTSLARALSKVTSTASLDKNPQSKEKGINIENKDKIQNLIKITEDETNKSSISDQAKFLADQKIQVLRSIN